MFNHNKEPKNTDRALHECTHCESKSVYPLYWTEVGYWHWHIVLRCPDCEEIDTGIFPQSDVEKFDNELVRAETELINGLAHLALFNMSEEVKFFVEALEADIVTADDFRDEPSITPEASGSEQWIVCKSLDPKRVEPIILRL